MTPALKHVQNQTRLISCDHTQVPHNINPSIFEYYIARSHQTAYCAVYIEEACLRDTSTN